MIISTSIENRRSRRELSNILSDFDLSYSEFETMYILLKDQPLQPTSLGYTINKDPASVSRTIKSLLMKSLITSEYSTEDRRQIFLQLTDVGAHLVRSVISVSCK